jgi:hypothetical protein
MSVGRWLAVVLGLSTMGIIANAQASEVAASPVASTSSEPTPRVFYTKQGQFEVIVLDVADAQHALALGRSVWGALSVPLSLPAEGFNSPVSVRLVPAKQWTEPAVFTVTVEVPGRVNVRVRWSDDVDPVIVRRAFVQGLILRQAVAWHGVGPRLTVPLWLEHACTTWSLIRERPAMQDAFQQESTGIPAPPALRSLLLWERGAVESRGWELASLWLFLQLRAEADDAPRWGGWVRGLVGGADPVDTLPRFYRGLWTDSASMELWWHVGFYHQSRSRVLPAMTADASRSWLANRSRWLASRGGREVVVSLDELQELRRESWVRAELEERVRQTHAALGVIHPFYANTTISLGRLYEAALRGSKKQFSAARTDFERDAIDGRELEDTVKAILDTAPRK